MLIEPRRLLLDIWQALARHSFDEGEWSWGAGGGLSSVADAERLLCLLRPATEIAAFRLDDPDTTWPDVARVLRSAGDPGEIPRRLVEVLGDFMAKHRGEDGPAFGGGSCFAPGDPARELSEEQRRFGVVDSYSTSVSLCLAVLGFLQVYRGRTRQTSTLIRVDRLRGRHQRPAHRRHGGPAALLHGRRRPPLLRPGAGPDPVPRPGPALRSAGPATLPGALYVPACPHHRERHARARCRCL